MKRLMMLLLLLTALLLPAYADGLSGYTLRESADEVKVYATPSLKANIVGYVIPGYSQQKMTVLEVQESPDGGWCYVRFTSIRGEEYGFIPLSRFVAETPATPTPAPAPEVIPGGTATIRSSQRGYRLNLRREPSASARSIAKYYSGVDVTFTGETKNGFACVTVQGNVGWMDLRYLDMSGSVLIETPVTTVSHSGGANVRRGPDTAYPRIGWYARGAKVYILGVTSADWYHVEFEDGVVGYVSSGLLKDEYPFAYGSDSDGPASSDLAADANVQYIATSTSTGKVNLRASASTSGGILGVYYAGTPVTVLSYTRTGWVFVRIGVSEGYVDANYLSASAPASNGRSMRVANPYADGLNLRSTPASSGELIAFLADGVNVTVYGATNNGWSYVSCGGHHGYVLADGLK